MRAQSRADAAAIATAFAKLPAGQLIEVRSGQSERRRRLRLLWRTARDQRCPFEHHGDAKPKHAVEIGFGAYDAAAFIDGPRCPV